LTASPDCGIVKLYEGKQMSKKKLISALILLLLSFYCIQVDRVEGSQKIAIEVQSHIAEGPLSYKFIYALKEEIRKSKAYRLTMNELPRIILRVATIENGENLIFYTITIVSYTKINDSWFPLFVNNFVGLNEQPTLVISKIDIAIDRYVRDLMKTNHLPK
jgi:hypothetical protein